MDLEHELDLELGHTRILTLNMNFTFKHKLELDTTMKNSIRFVGQNGMSTRPRKVKYLYWKKCFNSLADKSYKNSKYSNKVQIPPFHIAFIRRGVDDFKMRLLLMRSLYDFKSINGACNPCERKCQDVTGKSSADT